MAAAARTYLDYNASAPLLDDARNAMLDVLNRHGNASSVHGEGRQMRKAIETARAQVGKFVGVAAKQVIFTSGATEAAVHALSPILRAGEHEIKIGCLYISAIEHACVLSGGRFAAGNAVPIPVTSGGAIDLDALDHLLGNHDHELGPPMVAIMLANNETGVIQPVREAAGIADKYGAYLVVDAVQAGGKIPISMPELRAHFLILSGHKLGGPQGTGALILADPSIYPAPLLLGGGQENHHRGGTENTAGIAGFGAACRWHMDNEGGLAKIRAMRDVLEAGIRQVSLELGNKVPQPVIFGESENRICNTSCFALAGIKAETALISLDLDGIAVSSGAACSSGKVKHSHVLAAMGIEDDLIAGALRISFGWQSRDADVERFLAAWKKLVKKRS